MLSVASFLLRYLIIAAAMAAAFYSGLLARADHLFRLDTAASVPAAVHLVPYNAAYVARLAAWQPEESEHLLRRALELNPYDYQSAIELGLLSEMQQGHPKTAERYYLQAAAIDHMFLPKWTLTNFYFRQQSAPEFFRWARETLQTTPYASDPVFTQMWVMSQDASFLAAAIPNRPRILVQYAWYLSNNQQFAAIPEILRRLVTQVGRGDPRQWGRDDLIASLEDRILASGDVRDALEIWTVLHNANWIRQSVPNAAQPLTNGDFRTPFFRHGFDWMPMDPQGVRVDQFNDEPLVRISLSGAQPDHCVLLQQYVPAEPGAPYLLGWRVSTRDLDKESGLSWRLHAIYSSAASDLISADLFAEPPAWQFHTPDGAKGFLLSLEYTRPLDSLRSSGTINLQNVSLNKQ